MHLPYKLGVCLLCVLSISKFYTRAAPAANQSAVYEYVDDDYDDDADDGDDYYAEPARSTTPATTVANRGVPITTTTYKPIVLPKRGNHVLEPSCPKGCLCLEDAKYVQCSNARLTQVPSDLPSTALIIDLSQNRIDTLHADDFANCSKVRDIDLSGNRLQQVNKEAFHGLGRLQRLRLANNRLSAIEPDTFTGAGDLSSLDLSNNSIELRDGGSFLNQPSLLELACRNCSWTRLYDSTFANLTNLTALKLDQNNFGKKINTLAFRPLRNLIKLRLPELDPDAVQELCSLLKSIDNISFKHFDVSCYELVLGASYNDSVILATDPPQQPSLPSQSSSSSHSQSSSSASSVVTQAKSSAVPTAKTKVMADNSNLTFSAPNRALTNLTLPTRGDSANPVVVPAGVLVTVSPTLESGEAPEKPYQVPISQEAINIMLIAIMLIAIVGIVVGLICRKDVGGIKTKCCRTRKPEAKDQVHPAEEIPLNKLA